MIMKERIEEMGNFNGWRGVLGLYFTRKEIQPLRRYGITASTPIAEAYALINA